MTRREGRALRRRRIATATGVVTVAALGLRAAATVARQRTGGGAPRPRQRVRTLAASPPRPPTPAASTAWAPPPPSHLVRRRGRQSASATVLSIVFALGGSALIGVAIASQRPAPAAPPLSVVTQDSPQPLSTAPAPAPLGPESWRHAAMAAVRPAPARAARENVAAAPAEGRPDRVSADRAPPMASSKPVTIAIPAIGVNSVVGHLGQAANGSLEVPAGAQYNDAAWYRHSPTPGSLGPAVMLGHVDSAAQGPSVFFRLGELRRGNRVTVTRADGSAAVFVVDDVRRYAKKSFPTELVYSDIDHAGLRILTCGGAFDDAAGSYLDNIVVFASLVGAKA